MTALTIALPSAHPFVIFLLASLSVGGLLYSFCRVSYANHVRLDTRLRKFAIPSDQAAQLAEKGGDATRKRRVKQTLRELEERNNAKIKKVGKATLIGRLRQGGLFWSRSTYFLVCAVAGVAVYVVLMKFARLGLAPSVGFGIAGALLLPHIYVTMKRRSRMNKFSAEFPNSLDIVVRGVKAGMPLLDCLKVIASEAQEPVRSEFMTVLHEQALGVPLDAALERMAERVPLSEARFFAIVIAIQSRTGGNLSEALGNLSKVLRDRKTLRAKIKAMSAEAKASAGIIGSMPVVVSILLYFTSPDYIMMLFETNIGQIVLAGSLGWMFAGSMMMRKMINFDF